MCCVFCFGFSSVFFFVSRIDWYVLLSVFVCIARLCFMLYLYFISSFGHLLLFKQIVVSSSSYWGENSCGEVFAEHHGTNQMFI